jgi:hypothetical protein
VRTAQRTLQTVGWHLAGWHSDGSRQTLSRCDARGMITSSNRQLELWVLYTLAPWNGRAREWTIAELADELGDDVAEAAERLVAAGLACRTPDGRSVVASPAATRVVELLGCHVV